MSLNQDNASVYKDLIGFLQSSRADLKLEATKAVLQVVTDRYVPNNTHYILDYCSLAVGVALHCIALCAFLSYAILTILLFFLRLRFIIVRSFSNEVLQLMEHGVLLPLLRIVSDTTDATSAENALQAILYLSSSVEQGVSNLCIEELLQHKAVARLVELVLSSSSGVVSQNKQLNLALAILANLTRTEQGTIELVGKTLPDEAVKELDIADTKEKTRPIMELLLDRFLNRQLITELPDYASLEPHEWDTLDCDPYQHFAAILMNATQLDAGTKFVLRLHHSENGTQQTSVFQQLLPQLLNNQPNPIRRRGISGMIRNCCLETDAAWWMLNVAKLTSVLLYPLAGPEELDLEDKTGMDPDLWLSGPDKQREVDGATRMHVVESILLLCASGRKSRETLRLAKTYVILKYADMVEEIESVSEQINECVQYLRRDEEGTGEGSSDLLVEESTRQKVKLLMPSSQVVVGSSGNDDYDEVD
jgi:hypothetical protein